MIDFGNSVKMIKISGKFNKPNTYNRLSRDISLFIQKNLNKFILKWRMKYRDLTHCKCFVYLLFPLFLSYKCVCICVCDYTPLHTAL